MSANPDEAAMTFWEHLDELRGRLIRSVLAVLIASTACWLVKEQLLLLLTSPFIDAWNEGALADKPALHFPAPAALFISYVKLALIGGFVLALPVLLYQLWAFIAPGLYSSEKRLAIPFVVCSTALFAGGAYFCWRIAAPMAFQYLLGFSGQIGDHALNITPTVMIGDYIEFVGRMLIAFGAVFELPVLIFFLSLAGVVNHLQLIKFARYFVVIAFVVGAVITPPDIMSQFLLAVPLCLLYVLSIGIAWLVDKSRRKKLEA